MKYFGFLTLFFTIGSSFGQSPIFNKSNAVYTPLTGATQHMKDSVWDDPSDWKPSEQSLPLGFTFQAFGKSINTFLWEQGAINYREGDTVIWIGLDADLCDYGQGTKVAKSPIFYKKEGSAGNYIMKLEWRSFGIYDEWDMDNKCKDSGNLQMWIYQNPQKIEMRWGPKNMSKFSTWFPTKLPIKCAKYDVSGGTSGLVLDADPANPTTYPFADTGTRGLTGWPVVSTLYTFDFSKTGSIKDKSLSKSQAYYSNHFIHTQLTDQAPIAIYSTDGRQVLNTTFVNKSADLGGLKPGVYIAIWKDNLQKQELRFLVTD